MKTHSRPSRPIVRLGMLFLLACPLAVPAAPPAPQEDRFPSSEGWKPLFNGKNLEGWKFRNPKAKRVWVACDNVRLDPTNPARLLPVGPGGSRSAALLCGEDGRGSDIMTVEDFYDYQLHLEFTVPKGSNSGVYNRGLFEIQVFDSFGVLEARLPRLRRPLRTRHPAREPGQGPRANGSRSTSP